MKCTRSCVLKFIILGSYFAFLIFSWITGYAPGTHIAGNFSSFLVTMMQILPCAFILIGLFEVWVKRETVKKHLGDQSSIQGYIWALILASATVGGILPAFIVAWELKKKGAHLNIIFTYLGATGICRIPMTLFEASFVGLKFTLIRLSISIPLVLFSSIVLGNYLEKHNYTMPYTQ